MKTIRYGIIGLGNIGSAHVENFMLGKIPNATVTAIADIKADRVERMQNKYPEHDFYKYYNADDLINSKNVDAIIVATPHFSHAEITIKALEKGLHVISEKPASVYTKQVKEMIQASKNSTGLFTVMFNQRTNPVYKKMREMILDGKIGKITRVNWTITNWFRTQNYYDSGDWRGTWSGEGGGVLYNQCPHQLDLLSWLVGENPSRVRAFCHFGKWHNVEIEDDVTAYLEFSNGATGVFITTTGEFPGVNRLEISGTKGRLTVETHGYGDDRYDTLTYISTDDSEEMVKNAKGFGESEIQCYDIEITDENPLHSGICRNFTNAILKKEDLIVSGDEALNCVELMNAMLLSTWLDKTVTLPIDDELYHSLLKERIAHSKRKENVVDTVLDTSKSY